MRAVASSCDLYAEPIAIFNSSAVRSPIRSECSFLINPTIAASSASPPIRIERDLTIPPSEITATSVVPPPISTIMDPIGSCTGSPAPIAAAIGSSIM